jgi:hypothetical protein
MASHTPPHLHGWPTHGASPRGSMSSSLATEAEATLDERNALRYNTFRGQGIFPARLLSKTVFGRYAV